MRAHTAISGGGWLMAMPIVGVKMFDNFAAGRWGSGDRGFHLHAHSVRRDRSSTASTRGTRSNMSAFATPASRTSASTLATLVELNRRMQAERGDHLSRGRQHVSGRLPSERASGGGDRCRPVDGRHAGRRDPADHRGFGDRVPAVPRLPMGIRRSSVVTRRLVERQCTEFDGQAVRRSRPAGVSGHRRRPARSGACCAARHLRLPGRRRQHLDRRTDRRT